ncbi:MAG: hypothetical protein HKN10_17400 [Myxococcales bacterium]|nr:hypothetical protein [Myxococcales bacterium]
MNRATGILAVAAAGALLYTFMPSCSMLADADDTLCFAIAEAKDGVVDWPDEEYLEPGYNNDCGITEFHECDHCDLNPWFESEEARAYIEGFGLAQGHGWGDLGRADMMTVNTVTKEIDTPLGRTYNAYANLVYANPPGIELDRAKDLKNFEYYDTFLKWMSAYVGQKTYRINGNCNRDCETVFSKECVIARTVSGPFRNDYTDLYQTFFYDLDAVWRASTIVHEVRHARDGRSHDACACINGSACDARWSSNGANTYELMWIAAYFYTPDDHQFITPARKKRAHSLFNHRKTAMFCWTPQWQLSDFWLINQIPEWYVHEAACSEDPRNTLPCMFLAN